MVSLYIVSTPIGNLEDITARGLRTLRGVDLILCEDTRVTRKLLERYKITTPTLSYHQHSKLKKVNHILGLLKQGKNLALVSDAGTPGISDPGNKLVEQVIESLSDQVEIVPIPGPSAVTAAASICGFPMEKFVFLGYPPAKRKRKKFFEEAAASKYPVIFFESPHRVIKSLNELKEYFHTSKYRSIVVCRELTKKFEIIYRGTVEEVGRQLEAEKSKTQGKIKGEFVVVVEAIR